MSSPYHEQDENRNDDSSAQDADKQAEQPTATDRGTPSDRQQEETGPLKHSGAGIASFVIAVIAWSAAIITMISALPPLIEFSKGFDPVNPTFTEEEVIEWLDENPSILALFAVMMLTGGLSFLGLVLGIISLFSYRRKKLFPILGTVFNGLPVLGFLVLFLAGMTVS